MLHCLYLKIQHKMMYESITTVERRHVSNYFHCRVRPEGLL